MRRIEVMSDTVRKQLQTIEYFSIALDESCDVGDTSKLLAWSYQQSHG